VSLRWRHSWLVLALAAPLGVAGAQVSPGSAASKPAPSTSRPAFDKDEEAAIRCLRSLRKKERPSDAELAARLARAGERLIPFYFDVLVARRVPAWVATEEPQVLSEVQEHVILLALERMERDAVRAHVEAALALDRGLPRRHAALGCLGAVGRSNDLPALLELALASSETTPHEKLAAALRAAVVRVLLRDPRAFPQLADLRRVTRPELLRHLVRAVGETKDPRGLAYLSEVAYWHEDLALDVMNQVPLVGPSGEEAIDDAVRVRLRSYLDETRVAHCRAAITGLAALEDQDAIGGLIPLLLSTNTSLVNGAHWALRQLTGLALPPDAQAWERWHQAELSWILRFLPGELQRLRNADPAVVSAGLRATLAHPLAYRELAAALPDLLQHRSPTLRILACRTLAKIGATGAVERLVGTLEDPQPDVADAALAALRGLTGLELPGDPEAWQEATNSRPRSPHL
jgi:hypothetical protein